MFLLVSSRSIYIMVNDKNNTRTNVNTFYSIHSFAHENYLSLCVYRGFHEKVGGVFWAIVFTGKGFLQLFKFL